MDEFSIRLLTLDSALRFAHFSIIEAKESLEKINSQSFDEKEKGRQQAIKLFRTLQSKSIDYKKLRGISKETRTEEILSTKLKKLSKYASHFLADIKSTWDTKEAIKILNEVILLEGDVEHILSDMKKETQKPKQFLYAGVDAGASKTKIVVSDKNGKVIGEATTGPSFPAFVGMIKSFDSIISGIKKATKDARLNFDQVTFKRICIGMAGLDTKDEHTRINNLMHDYIVKFNYDILDFMIIQDSLLAFYGALEGEPGIMVIGGTGFFIYGYNRGKEASDKMSGIERDWKREIRLGGRHISYHAAKSILKNIRKKSDTILEKRWLEAFNRREIFSNHSDDEFKDVLKFLIDSMFKRAAKVSDREIASLAKLVFECANEGDKDSRKIIKEAASTASYYISRVAEKIGLHNRQFKVVFVGSVIRHPFAFRNLKKTIKEFEPYAELIDIPKLEPWDAGIKIAMENIRFY